jgi:hypothetical protein
MGEEAGKHRLLQPSATAAVVIGAHDWSDAGLGRTPSFLRSAKGILGYLIDSAGLNLDPALVLDLFDDTSSAGEQLARIGTRWMSSYASGERRGARLQTS